MDKIRLVDMVKSALFVSYLWNVSERDVERAATWDLGVS